MPEKKTLRFNVKFSDVEDIGNPLFSKAKINVLYTGINRNNTYFSKESVEAAIPTLFNIPIIGEYLENVDNFGGHGGKLEVSDKGIKFIQTTQPYGVVPESANVSWDTVTEEDGSVHDYLVIDGAYLWTGRYSDELDDLLKEPYGQSMEVEIEDGEYEKVDGVETYNIKSFTFSALCILGIDKENDPDGKVEPCFESANIVAYSLNRDDFKKQFKQMVSELKFALNAESQSNPKINKGGSVKLNEKLELLKKYSLTKEEFEKHGFKLEDSSLEEIEAKIKEFALTGEQFAKELADKVGEEKITDDWGYTYSRYYYIDYDPATSEVFAEDNSDNYKLVGFNYSVNGDAITIDFNSKKRKKCQFVDFEGEDGTDISGTLIPAEQAEYAVKVAEKKAEEKFNKESKTDQDKFSKLEKEVSELRKFKEEKEVQERKNAEEALFSEFSSELDKTDLDLIKENASKFSIDELKLQLYAAVGKKKAKFSMTKKSSPIKVSIDPIIPEDPEPYNGFIEKYGKKIN